MTFEEFNLPSKLFQAITDLEFETPTPIQEKAFPAILSGRDVIGIAQTGTGKTFAYLLPLLRQLKFSEQKEPRILIIVPTRELVIQVTREAEKLACHMNIRITGIYGGTNINTQKQTVYDGIDVLIATPGRMWDLAMSGVLRLKYIQKFVIDEVDEMLNLGFRTQLINIMEALPEKRQNLMFSATLKDEIKKIIDSYFNVPLVIEIAPHGTPIESITQWVYHVPNFFTKVNLLVNLLNKDESMSKVLVFTKHKKQADKLFELIDKKFPGVTGVMHSNKSQNLRVNTLNQFGEGKFRILIATDLVARGLDIFGVSHVINFDTPEIPGDYIHRIGRTGRADQVGVAITFVNDPEVEYLQEIEKMMHQAIAKNFLPEDLVMSEVYLEEERPTALYDKDYLKPQEKKVIAAFHEKKGKNKKINLGGPKKRNPKYGKPLKPKF